MAQCDLVALRVPSCFFLGVNLNHAHTMTQNPNARRKSLFRPCIDLHNGEVKQIVGGTLNEDDPSHLKTNFVARCGVDAVGLTPDRKILILCISQPSVVVLC